MRFEHRTGRGLRTLRVIVSVLALLATVARLSAAVVMPLLMQPPPPSNTDTDDTYQRFIAAFGTNASLCAAMPVTVAQYKPPSHDGPHKSSDPDCDVCPLCTAVRGAVAAAILAPVPTAPVPTAFVVAPAPLPVESVKPVKTSSTALARAPPAV